MELSLAELEKLANAAVPQAGGNLLSTIANMVKQFREGAELLNNLKNKNLTEAAGEIAKKEPGGGMAHFLTLINQLGLGELPIGKILEQVGPYSVNQLQKMGGNMLIEAPEDDKPPKKKKAPPGLGDVRKKANEN